MAWISVHTGIDGPKLRDFRKILRCSKFEATGILVYLWHWGLENATTDGHILHADKEDIVECVMQSSAGCSIPAEKIVDALLDAGWIDQNENGFYLHDWETWQEQWYKAKARRESDTKRKQESRRKKAWQTESSNSSSKDEFNDSPAECPQNATKNPEEDQVEVARAQSESPKYIPAFDLFWSEYPRQIGKGEAYKKYQARRKEGYSDEELLEAAKNYALQCIRLGTEKQYIKHPKTFLSDSRPFLDYLPKQEAQAPKEDPLPMENPFKDWGG